MITHYYRLARFRFKVLSDSWSTDSRVPLLPKTFPVVISMPRLILCLAILSLSVSTISIIALSHTYSAHASAENANVAATAVMPAQADTHSVREFPITVNDVVFDRNTGKFYASIPSKAGATGNSIAKIDPATGQVENSVFVGSEPGKLALSDDGHTLYVSLDGAAAVRKFDITTQTAGQQFPLGDATFEGPFFVKDMAVSPGEPDVVAVSRKNMTGSPDFEGVAVYDHGVRRTLTTPRHTGSDFIAYSASAATLFGSGADFTGLQKMSVTPTGVSVITSTPSGTGGDFKFDNGFLYLSFGRVFNGSTMLPVGTFTLSGLTSAPQVEPDSSVGRVYFLTGDSAFGSDSRTMTIQAFDQNTFLPVGSLAIPNVRGAVSSLIRWGANGLAFGTNGGQFMIIQTTLVPANEPIPTPTPTPSPTPTATPTPTPGPGQLREVQIVAKDIVIDPAGTIYASVPSTAGVSGNSITPIDPVANAVGQPVFVGSEPNKLAISDDGQVIYVGLDGARAIRRFDVPTRTPGLQFAVDSQGQNVAVDLAVAPGQPQTVAAARGSNGNASDGGVAIYDDGVQRPNTTGAFHTISFIHYSASPLILYGHNAFTSESGFRKMAAASCGVTVLSTKGALLAGDTDFQIENGSAFSARGRVADPETGTLIGTYPVTTNLPTGTFPTAVIADSHANRVYFFLAVSSADVAPNTMLMRAFDMKTFLEVGALALPNISGKPTAAVRWGTDGFAFRTNTNKVYLIQTSLVPSASQPVIPAPAPTPPTYTLRGTVSPAGGPPLPTFTVQLSGGQTTTTTTNPDGSFAFTDLPLCTDFIVTPVPSGNYTFSPASVSFPASSQNNPNAQPFFSAIPPLIGFSVFGVSVPEGNTTLLFSVTRNNTSSAATVDYQTTDGTASERTDYSAAIGTLRFAPGESTKVITVFVNDDVLHEANETFTIGLSNPTGAFLSNRPSVTVTITDNDASDGTTNPVDDATFFVRQHYRDFLNRDPDASGLAFWVNEITSCGSAPQCLEVKRINVSAAFFLSIEFQETGYFAYRVYKTAYGDATSPNVTGTVPVIRFKEFLADAHRLGENVQVGIGNWEQQLDDNKNGYALEFVQRQRFINAFPLTMTAAEFVSKLDQNTGGALTAAEKSQLIAVLGATPADSSKRASVLRAVADAAALRAAESNRAFVLMQYYGYLRRNPDDPQDVDFAGWKFWLDKLNQFNGNFVEAQMVKAFITSIEYRHRFGTQ